MTKKSFETGDQIGRFIIDEFGGTNTSGQPWWWVTENGESKHVTEKKLRTELRRVEFTPQMIRNLSSKAYAALRQEIGDDGLEEILSTSKPKSEAPSSVQQREIASKWFSWHPQVPRTRANTKLFDDYLASMPNPTFTSQDFDRAFSDIFTELELNPKAAGIEGMGEAIRGETAIRKLSATQITQLQKPFPVPLKAEELTPKQALRIVADTMTAKEYDAFTREVDKSQGIPQPIPPLLLHAREQTWSQFFQLHPNVIVTSELKDKLQEYLTKNGLFFALQHLGLALNSLIEQKDTSVVEQESGVHTYGSHTLVIQEPRPKSPIIPFDDVPVTVTTAEINAMDAKTYDEKLKNPNFKKAIDNLLARATGRA